MPAIDLGDVQVVAGFSAFVYGVSLQSVSAAWMTAGGMLLAGWLAPRLPRRSKKGS